MGLIAEMMIDGTLCQVCGVYIEGEACDFPRSCKECAKDQREAGRDMRKTGLGGYQDHGRLKTKPNTPCPHCGKKVQDAGLADHLRDRHRL